MAEEFVLPELTPTPSGWGPTSVPSGFANIPFAPFRKNDRLGKAADFSSFRGQQSRRAADEEERFEVVDTTKVKRVDIRKYYRRQGYQNNHHAQRAAAQQQVVKTGRGTKQRQSRRRKNYSRRYYRRPQNNVVREPSLRIRSTWEMVDQFDLPALSKLSTTVPSAEDLRWCGSLKRFDPKFDRLSSRATRDLRSFTDRMFFSETAQEDPIIDEIASNSSMGCNVFTTDAVLAHLMTAQRTVYPWDIVITVYPGGVVSLDGRDHQQFEQPTVYETANVPPTEENDDDINSRASLTAEATLINYNFSQQVLAAASVTDVPDASENPFWSPEAGNGAPAADVMYRYRKWQVTPDICLAARTTIHAAQPKKDGTLQYVTLHALNEWDPKASNARPWRQQIDTQRGGVVATELKNNASKMAKWVASTILSGADQMKVGFVSRMTPKSRDRHVILGVQNYDPENFAHQASLTQTNMWGVLRWLIELVRTKADQYRTDDEEVMKFALMRDPNKPLIMLYRVPVDAFDTDQEGEEEDEDEDDDDIEDSDIDVMAGGGRLG